VAVSSSADGLPVTEPPRLCQVQPVPLFHAACSTAVPVDPLPVAYTSMLPVNESTNAEGLPEMAPPRLLAPVHAVPVQASWYRAPSVPVA
jgi:hypothetical protein